MMADIGVVIPHEVFPTLKRMLPRILEDVRNGRNSTYLAGMAEVASIIDSHDSPAGSWTGRRAMKNMRHNFMDTFVNIDLGHNALLVPSIPSLVGCCSLGQWDWVNKNIENGHLKHLERVLTNLFRDMNQYFTVLRDIEKLQETKDDLHDMDIVVGSSLMNWIMDKAKKEGSVPLQSLVKMIRHDHAV